MRMLKQGLYIAENNDSIWDAYTVKMLVKETEKAYTFELVELQSRYSASHIKLLFQKSNKIILKKDKGGHAMRIWGDSDLTIYPYQVGIPYYFKLKEAQC